jgi:N-acetylneuraminate synthase/N,N'-diacetyllegionaminate synthase
VRIAGRDIGPAMPPYIIAEIGVNHDGDPSRAVLLTEAAAWARADAVKFQLFESDRLMSRASRLALYQQHAGENDPWAMLRRLELSVEQMRPAVRRARALGLHAIVTVFSLELVGPAESLACDAYKSASPDIINRPLLDAMAATGRPLIVSTGASEPDEVARAADWLAHIRGRLAFLQCVSSYPAPEPALEGIPAVASLTCAPTGYSDHTESIETGALAVAHGAVILERHLTDDAAAPGPDHAASLEPEAFARYAELARRSAARPVAEPRKRVLDCERDVRLVSRQSLVTRHDLPAGHALTPDDLTIKRPGTGLEPWRLQTTIGMTLARAVPGDQPLTTEDLS